MPVQVPPRPYHGPYLRFHEYDARANTWACSVLYVLQQIPQGGNPPALMLADGPTTSQWPGYVVDAFEEWQCWRFNFHTQLTGMERQLQYWLGMSPELPGNKSYHMMIPGLERPLHWGFKSCDWFSGGVDPAPWGGHAPVWKDMLDLHARKPIHVMIGGGDQIYQDPVMEEVPQLKSWTQLSDRRQRETASFTPELRLACERYYFYHYLEIFGKESMAEIYASVPQILIWDDHDIIDGWGSYPAQLQGCPVFQGLFNVAKRFYLLFQHHTSDQLAYTEGGMFGDGAYNFLRHIHPEVAVLGVDMRGRRTIQQIVTPSNYDLCFQRLDAMHSGIKHLVLISAVPMAYPELPGSELTLKMLSGMSKESMLNQLMGKTGVSSKLMKFDEPELLDDLRDHWGSSSHKKEREQFLARLQKFASDRACRVSIISGDVHLAAFGLFYTHPKLADPKVDPKWMINATSSASVNPPPPNALVKLLTSANHASNMDAIKTREKMIRVFAKRNPASDKLLARRNWCSVTLTPQSTGNAGNMLFELRAEYDVNTKKTYSPQPFEIYHVDVPPLTIKPARTDLPPPIRPVPAPLPGTTAPTRAPQGAQPGNMVGYPQAPTPSTAPYGGPAPSTAPHGAPAPLQHTTSGVGPGLPLDGCRPSVASTGSFGGSSVGGSQNASYDGGRVTQMTPSAPPYSDSQGPTYGGPPQGPSKGSMTSSLYPPAPGNNATTPAGYGQTAGTAGTYSQQLTASSGGYPQQRGGSTGASQPGGTAPGYLGSHGSHGPAGAGALYPSSAGTGGGNAAAPYPGSTAQGGGGNTGGGAGQYPEGSATATGMGGAAASLYPGQTAAGSQAGAGTGSPYPGPTGAGAGTAGVPYPGQTSNVNISSTSSAYGQVNSAAAGGQPQGAAQYPERGPQGPSGVQTGVQQSSAAPYDPATGMSNLNINVNVQAAPEAGQYPNMAATRPGGQSATGGATGTTQPGSGHPGQMSPQGSHGGPTGYPQSGGGAQGTGPGYPQSSGGAQGAQGTGSGYPQSTGAAQGTGPGYPQSSGSAQGAPLAAQASFHGAGQVRVQSTGPAGAAGGSYPSSGGPGGAPVPTHAAPYPGATRPGPTAGSTGAGYTGAGGPGPTPGAGVYPGAPVNPYAPPAGGTQPYGAPAPYGGAPNPYLPPAGSYPPPGGMYPPPAGSYPPQGGYPQPGPMGYPPTAGYPPPGPSYPTPGAANYPPQQTYPGWQPPPGGPAC